jgi:hypothetical protein
MEILDMNKNLIAYSYDLEKLEQHLKRTSKYLQVEFEVENRLIYTITELILVLLCGTIAGFSLFAFIEWLDSVQPYPTITNIFFVLFIFGFTFISAIFFFNRASDLKHYSFFKKRFLKKNKALLSTLLGHYNLTIDDVDIDYKNLEISLKSKNKQK